MMHKPQVIEVAPVAGGWRLDSPLCGLPLIFRSGRAAEASAHRLARAAALSGEAVEVLIRDREGRIVGSFVSEGSVTAGPRLARHWSLRGH